jgi:hypothetical protein
MWCVIGGVAAVLLALTLRRMPNPTGPWIRPGLWTR